MIDNLDDLDDLDVDRSVTSSDIGHPRHRTHEHRFGEGPYTIAPKGATNGFFNIGKRCQTEDPFFLNSSERVEVILKTDGNRSPQPGDLPQRSWNLFLQMDKFNWLEFLISITIRIIFNHLAIASDIEPWGELHWESEFALFAKIFFKLQWSKSPGLL